MDEAKKLIEAAKAIANAPWQARIGGAPDLHVLIVSGLEIHILKQAIEVFEKSQND